jgi:hypothetical protein
MPQSNVVDYLLLIVTPFWRVTCAAVLLAGPGWWLADRLRFDPLTKLLIPLRNKV